MRRRLNPWVVLLSAALTFGSLMAFVGHRSFDRFRDHRPGTPFWNHERGYGSCEDDRPGRRPDGPRREQSSTGSDSTSFR